MIRQLVLLSWGLIIYSSSISQELSGKYASLITVEDLRKNLSVIAADSLEGRQTGSSGEAKAAKFIAGKFQAAGLQPLTPTGFLQPFKLYSVATKEVYLEGRKQRFNNYEDMVFYGMSGTNGEVNTNVVFAGKGTQEETSELDLRDKGALVWLDSLDLETVGTAARNLMQAGVKITIIYSPMPDSDFALFAAQMKQFFSSGAVSLQPFAPEGAPLLLFVNRNVVIELFGNPDKLLKKAAGDGGLKKIKPAPVTLHADVQPQALESQNVLGLLEGTDLRNEVIVITAHHDHIGISDSGSDRINNGADDDGSGTVTVLQLAHAFAKAKADGNGPRRSILFMTVSGEEQGLYGSQWYTDFQPVIPLTSTVVNLNIDMIGRVDPQHEGKPDYVYVVGSDKLSKELHQLSERTNAAYTKMDLDYTYNDEHHPTNIYKRSDHWNFAKHGVPIIFYFDGIHGDYHRPSDEIEKINFELLAKRAQLVFYTAWEIANRESTIRPD